MGDETRGLAKLRFLVADDRDMLMLLIPFLQEMGVTRIRRATDGRAALDHLVHAGHEIDIIICDSELPKANGLEVLKHVRRRFADKPFLMLASQVTRKSVATARAHGVSAFLMKPFNAQALKQRVHALAKMLSTTAPAPATAPATPPSDHNDSESDSDSWMI